MNAATDVCREPWPETLVEIAALARRALEHRLDVDEHGKPVSGGSCLYGSALLAELIERFSGGRAVIRGGSGEDQTGAVDSAGEWHGHYWVEAERDGIKLVVDITGDQFGHKPVRVLGLRESERVLIAGPQDVVNKAAEQIRREVGIK